MGTGWRKAFCSTIAKNRDFTTDMVKLPEEQEDQQKLRFLQKFGFLSSGSNPSTPRFHSNSHKLSCKTNNTSTVQQPISNGSPKLQCNASTTPKSCIKDSRKNYGSNPSSPRSPLSILKTTLRRTKSSCGVCTHSAKTNQRMAIFTGECSHTFHFPCIAEYTKKHTSFICPVCQSTWKDVPLLTNHKLHYQNLKEKQVQEISNFPKTLSQNVSSRNVKQEPLPIAKNGDLEVYNDDESLVSPESAQFLPENENPEEADEVQEDVQEFQGFFVNSAPSDEASRYNNTLNQSRYIEVSLLPEAAVVAVGQTYETLALVLKVKAPSSAHISHPAQFNETARRASVDLVSVLDLSGSMSGPKLEMLKRAMKLVISSLGSADRLSIVSFSATPKRLLPLTRMNAHSQQTARHIIDQLSCSQGTSVSEALKIAAKILQDRCEKNPVATVILLSDGSEDMLQPKDDRQRQRDYHESTTRFSHIEIPVRSSGFGRKFGSINEPNEDAFFKCVGGLLSVVLHDLQIQISIGSGSDSAEIAAIYSCTSQPSLLSLGCIRVGDLYAEEEREFLVELKVPVSSFMSHHVLSVKCSYKCPTTKEQYSNICNNLLVPRPQSGQSSLPRSEWLRNLFVYTRALAESRRLIELNELKITADLLTSALNLVMQSKCGSAKEFIKGLELKLSEVQWRQQMVLQGKFNDYEASLLLDKYGEPLTPISARRAAVKLAKPVLRRSMSQITDLHGFENARF